MAIGQVMIHVLEFLELNFEKLQVCVTDFNDHPPKFVSPPKNFTIRVPENEQVRVMMMFVKIRQRAFCCHLDIGIQICVKSSNFRWDPL